jgi:hypothetical protein
MSDRKLTAPEEGGGSCVLPVPDAILTVALLAFYLQDSPEKVFDETRELTDGLNSSVSSSSGGKEPDWL